MRKMLTSKLKSNESLFLAAKQKHFALCSPLCWRPIGCQLPPTPPHPLPTGAALLPSVTETRFWIGRQQQHFLTHQEHFPRGKSVLLLLSPNPVPSPWKRKITIRSCSFSKLASQKRISAQFHLGSTNSQVYDDVGPNPSPFVSNRFVFSSSFP